jgi:hypothetical protein
LTTFLNNGIFLIRKMSQKRKIPTESGMIDQLRQGLTELPPLTFRYLNINGNNGGRDLGFDALIEVFWLNEKARFGVECKALSTPKAFKAGLNYLKLAKLPKGYLPMLFLPFLGESQLKQLETEQISGIDLCGNGIVIVPGKFFVFRTGGENRFRSWAPIKNIYRKNSSMVGRLFLARPQYDAVQEIQREINRRNPLVARWGKIPIGLSTVSKALKSLEEDLVISRNDGIRLLQAEKLLEKLSENYELPVAAKRVHLKIQETPEAILNLLAQQSQKIGLPIMAAGTSTVSRYTVMPRGDMLSVYCPRIEDMLIRLPNSLSDRFPNLELIEVEDETVYFDARQEEGFLWASPVQVYLELMAGDKRDRETAEQLKPIILKAHEPTPR